MEKNVVSISPSRQGDGETHVRVVYHVENTGNLPVSQANIDVNLYYENGQISEDMSVAQIKETALSGADAALSQALSKARD